MNKIQASFETLPVQISPPVFSKSVDVRTDIQHHLQALCELVNVLLDQVESLPTRSGDSVDLPFLSLRDEVRRFEIDLIQHALTRTRGSQVHAAKLLGVNATTLNAKLKRYRLQWPYATSSSPSLFNQPNTESLEGA